MAEHVPSFVWIPELFSKALIKNASTRSPVSLMAWATIMRNYSAYVIRVLEAPAEIRQQVMDDLLANHSATGQEQLMCCLAAFETLSPSKKAAFIDAYKGAATLVGQGTIEAIRTTGWDPLHIPPRLEP